MENNQENVQAPMTVAAKAPSIEIKGDTIGLPVEMKESIAAKAEEIKTRLKLRKVYPIVVKGGEDDGKPWYIGYFKRPGLMAFSQWMNFVSKDAVQANLNLARNIFVEGDRETVDDEEIFLYGTMSQISEIMEPRQAELVKLSSVTK